MLQDGQIESFIQFFLIWMLPSFIFAEEYIPNEELNTRCFPRYHYPDTVFLEEEFLYSDLIKNGMFHKGKCFFD